MSAANSRRPVLSVVPAVPAVSAVSAVSVVSVVSVGGPTLRRMTEPTNSPADTPGTPPPSEHGIAITVDHREQPSGLVRALSDRWPHVYTRQLGIGDVEIGPRVIVERKTVHDFVVSLRDGRLYRQAYALRAAADRPLLVVEGRDGVPWVNTSARALRAALLTLATGYRVPVLRTGDVDESAELLTHLAQLETRRRDRYERAQTAGQRRRTFGREPTAARLAIDMLGAIPGVGDLRASALVERFRSVTGVMSATDDELTELPGVGAETVRRVRHALGRDDACDRPGREDGSGHVGERAPRWERAPSLAACSSLRRIRARPERRGVQSAACSALTPSI